MILRKAEKILFHEVNDELVLLNPDTGDYFGLNEVGSAFWKRIDGSSSFEKILQEMIEIFDVDLETLNKDLLELKNDMMSKRLLCIADA